jgi:hypothetical protein
VRGNNRESVWSNIHVTDAESTVRDILCTDLGMNLTDKILVQYNVTREEVNADTGIVPETAVVVERTYRYYDTYNGIKIADSFVEGRIDSDGINAITVQRQIVTDSTANAARGTKGTMSNKEATIITQNDALKIVYQEEPSILNADLYNVALAYAPDEIGDHVLCYEFAFSYGFRYVDVVSGEIVRF